MGTLPTQYVAVSIIFFCSGLLLRTDEIQAAFSAWRASGWGIVSILFITPAIGVVLAFQVPVQAEFQLGLALFCCMPTTLSSGIALTQQARGNVALALLLTVSTNLLGIFTVPFVLAQLLGASRTGGAVGGRSAGQALSDNPVAPIRRRLRAAVCRSLGRQEIGPGLRRSATWH